MPSEKIGGPFSKLLNTDDYESLGRRKALRLVNLFLSEFLGTAFILFLGCSAAVSSVFGTKNITYLAVCLTFSFAIATSILTFGHISGSHLNPCLSLVSVVVGNLSLANLALYTVAQCSGAAFGYYLITLVHPNPNGNLFNPNTLLEAEGACCTVPPPYNTSDLQVLLMEVIATAILSFVACSAWDPRNKGVHDSMPLKFGFAVLVLAIPAASYSGCSLNPARSFGPALVTGYWSKQWIYWVGPFVGSIIASLTYIVVFKESYMTLKPKNRNTELTTLQTIDQDNGV